MLRNDLIFLRALDPADLDTILAWENDTELWPAGSSSAPFSRHQIWEYLRNYTADIYAQRQLRMMICLSEDSTPVGMIDLFDFEPRHGHAKIGLMVDTRFRRRKIGSQALSLIVDYARDMLSLHLLAVDIAADNLPSLRLFQQAGFQQAGLLKDWLRTPSGYGDMTVLQLIL